MVSCAWGDVCWMLRESCGLPCGILAVQLRVEPGIVTSWCVMVMIGLHTFSSERCAALSWLLALWYLSGLGIVTNRQGIVTSGRHTFYGEHCVALSWDAGADVPPGAGHHGVPVWRCEVWAPHLPQRTLRHPLLECVR